MLQRYCIELFVCFHFRVVRVVKGKDLDALAEILYNAIMSSDSNIEHGNMFPFLEIRVRSLCPVRPI